MIDFQFKHPKDPNGCDMNEWQPTYRSISKQPLVISYFMVLCAFCLLPQHFMISPLNHFQIPYNMIPNWIIYFIKFLLYAFIFLFDFNFYFYFIFFNFITNSNLISQFYELVLDLQYFLFCRNFKFEWISLISFNL